MAMQQLKELLCLLHKILRRVRGDPNHPRHIPSSGGFFAGLRIKVAGYFICDFMDNQPLYLLISEALKHLKNRNYGLLENVLYELWERQAEQHHAQQDPDEDS